MKHLALALLVALLPPLDLARDKQEEKIALKFNPRKGDKLATAQKTEMSIKAKVTVASEQEQAVEMEQKETQKTTSEITEVADGAVTRMVLVVKEHLVEKKSPQTQQASKKEKPLHGKTITLTLKDGKVERTGAEDVDEATLDRLDLNDRTSHIFPKGPVGVGDRWEAQGEQVRKFLAADQDLQTGNVKVQLLEVKTIDGRRCAVLNAVLGVAGKASGGTDLTIKLDCEIVVWIDRGYTLSVKGKGEIEMKTENDQYKMKGQGTVFLEILTRIE